jgi:hypothetical protein
MREYEKLRGMIGELAEFLGASDCTVWADRLRLIAVNSESTVPLQKLRDEVRQLFGGMGSLTDIDIYFEGDAQRTKSANQRLNQLLDDLFDMV